MNAASVKARLKNIAVDTGRNFQELLVSYGLERTIYRISLSEYIDLLARNIGNDIDTIENVFRSILARQTENDPLQYDLESLRVRSITEFDEYHGVNISVTAYLERTQIPVSIDIGFGDVIYPDRTLMDFHQKEKDISEYFFRGSSCFDRSICDSGLGAYEV